MDKRNNDLKKSLEAAGQSAEILYKLGASLCIVGRYSQASAYFEKLIGLVPDDPAVYAYLGTIYQAMGNYKIGNEYLLKAKTLLEARGDLWCAAPSKPC